MRARFAGLSDERVPPVAVPVDPLPVVQSGRGVGLRIPPRLADCSGRRPSWYPFQVNVCEVDAPDPLALTRRHQSI